MRRQSYNFFFKLDQQQRVWAIINHFDDGCRHVDNVDDFLVFSVAVCLLFFQCPMWLFAYCFFGILCGCLPTVLLVSYMAVCLLFFLYRYTMWLFAQFFQYPTWLFAYCSFILLCGCLPTVLLVSYVAVCLLFFQYLMWLVASCSFSILHGCLPTGSFSILCGCLPSSFSILRHNMAGCLPFFQSSPSLLGYGTIQAVHAVDVSILFFQSFFVAVSLLLILYPAWLFAYCLGPYMLQLLAFYSFSILCGCLHPVFHVPMWLVAHCYCSTLRTCGCLPLFFLYPTWLFAYYSFSILHCF